MVPTPGDHFPGWGGSATPLVLVDRPADGLVADLVGIDDRRAASDAVAHLIAHGHRDIAYVGDFLPRWRPPPPGCAGYRDSMVDGVAGAGALGMPDGRAAAARCQPCWRYPPPTAMLSAATRASLGVVPALHSAGRTDVAWSPSATSLWPIRCVPPLPSWTTRSRVGRVAAARLLARLDQPGLPVERIGVPARLIERGSGEQRP